MKRMIVVFAASLFPLTALANPLHARNASPKEYGSAGTFEVGGTFAITSGTSDFDNGGTTTSTSVLVSPGIGYYVVDGLELLGGIGMQMSKNEYENGVVDSFTSVAIGVGAGYYFRAGALRLGPSLMMRFANASTSQEGQGGTTSLDVDQRGTGLEIAFTAKVPVGGGGVLTAGVGMQHSTVAADVQLGNLSGTDDGTVTAFGTSVGFSVFF